MTDGRIPIHCADDGAASTGVRLGVATGGRKEGAEGTSGRHRGSPVVRHAARSQKIGFVWVCFRSPVLQAKSKLGLFGDFFVRENWEPQMNTDERVGFAASGRAARINSRPTAPSRSRLGLGHRGTVRQHRDEGCNFAGTACHDPTMDTVATAGAHRAAA
jgi:hypothetical protein